jgi:hypothetical protein
MSEFWLVMLPLPVAVVAVVLWGWICGLFPYPRVKVMLPGEHGRFCRDCVNFLPQRLPPFGLRRGVGFARCRHPTAMRDVEDFLVRGYLHEDNMGYASIQRRNHQSTLIQFLPPERLSELQATDPPSACGPQGRYWEQR